jgi:RNA polymerase sigma-70 factor (ECF subfamily)
VLRHREAGGLLHAGGEDALLRHGREGAEGLRLQLSDAAVDPAAAWQEFHGRLLGFVARRVAVEADAEDIVQHVFLQLHRNLPRLRGTERLGAWLYQAARNAIADHYRSPRRRREVPAGGVAELEPLASAADEEQDAVDAAACLRPLIGRLAEADRQALERIEIQGMSQQEAARAEGQSLTAMKSRVQRARRRLKAALLACCQVALDARGGVVGCESRTTRATCGAGEGRSCRS